MALKWLATTCRWPPTKHHLIVAHDVVNVGSDRGELWSMATKAREAIGKNKLEVIADRGYFKGPELLACEQAGIKTYVPKPMTSNAKAQGRFSKADECLLPRPSKWCNRPQAAAPPSDWETK